MQDAVPDVRVDYRRLASRGATGVSRGLEPPLWAVHSDLESGSRRLRASCFTSFGLWRRKKSFALRLLARKLSSSSHRFGQFSHPPLRGLFVGPPLLHFAEHTFSLQLALQRFQSLFDIVVADENLQE